MVTTSNPSTQEAEARRLKVEVSLCYIVRPCLKQKPWKGSEIFLVECMKGPWIKFPVS